MSGKTFNITTGETETGGQNESMPQPVHQEPEPSEETQLIQVQVEEKEPDAV